MALAGDAAGITLPPSHGCGCRVGRGVPARSGGVIERWRGATSSARALLSVAGTSLAKAVCRVLVAVSRSFDFSGVREMLAFLYD